MILSTMRRLRIRHVVFLALLLAGIVPLAVSSWLLISQNRNVLKSQEEEELLRSARSLSRELDGDLQSVRLRLDQLGHQLLAFASRGSSTLELLRSNNLNEYLRELVETAQDIIYLTVVDVESRGGPAFGPEDLEQDLVQEAVEEASDSTTPVVRFVVRQDTREPAAILAVPIVEAGGRGDAASEPRLVAAAMLPLRGLDRLFRQEAQGEVEVFLLGEPEEGVLWSQGVDEAGIQAIEESERFRDIGRTPVSLVTGYENAVGKRMVARVSQVQETGWAVVVQRPEAVAYEVVDTMVFNAMISSVLLLILALAVSLFAARQLSHPIQELAESSHEIAGGNFGQRVETDGLIHELAALGDDFNRMSGYVERYIGELKEAARANRDLFIGSLRAFAAAIDAKDPYTRGHSERVARVARIIARQLGLPAEQQERIWISAVLHDVGKIGIEDRVLQKVERLTEEEFVQMKLHPVIGAEIIAPIEQLKYALPVIRSHHENWNGKGYPDGLRGEAIPLEARIVAVADTFDAVTTNRPYQQAFTLEFAVETITNLTGKRFDAKVTTAFLKAYEQGEITVAEEPGRPDIEPRSETEVQKRVSSMT